MPPNWGRLSTSTLLRPSLVFFLLSSPTRPGTPAHDISLSFLPSPMRRHGAAHPPCWLHIPLGPLRRPSRQGLPCQENDVVSSSTTRLDGPGGCPECRLSCPDIGHPGGRLQMQSYLPAYLPTRAPVACRSCPVSCAAGSNAAVMDKCRRRQQWIGGQDQSASLRPSETLLSIP